MNRARSVTIVEVGPRDGFQPIVPWIATEKKVRTISRLLDAGLRRIEITSFTSPKAIPQMRDAPEIVEACARMGALSAQVLVPNTNYAHKAMEAGAKSLAYVFSVSEAHNLNNVKRTVEASVNEFRELVKSSGSYFSRLNLSTAFDCPFEGRIGPDAVLRVLDLIGEMPETCEICLCDTTGRATPDHVGSLFTLAMERFPSVNAWAFHGHDTYGLGAANCYAAYQSGVRVFDGAIGGLGGCPFAPGATGNAATEDIVWMFERMGIDTGTDLRKLVSVAEEVIRIPGAFNGGRVRQALTASCQGNTHSTGVDNV